MINIIGLASRARKVTTGTDRLLIVRKGKIKLVFLATNASDNTKKLVSDKCKYYNVQVIEGSILSNYQKQLERKI